MDIEDGNIWQVWANFLQRWGLDDWTAALLEAVGPLSILGAQFVFMAQPFLSQSRMAIHLEAISRILEAPESTRAFVAYLREAQTQ